MTEYNPLRKDEVNAGPAVGQEHRVEKSLLALYELLKIVTVVPKVLEVIKHNQQLLSDTGPRRAPEAPNKNYKKRERRKKWREQHGK
jgi:hypothetical protein